MNEQCDICCGSKHTLIGNRCICNDGTKNGLISGLREIILEKKNENKRLQDIVDQLPRWAADLIDPQILSNGTIKRKIREADKQWS